MPDLHRALDWLARRHAGESAAHVAHHADVTAAAVLYATRGYGPFPRPTQQLGRTTVSDHRLDERGRERVEELRRGRTAAEIARLALISKGIFFHGGGA